MDEEEYIWLEKLESDFKKARGVCDPLEYMRRQQNLLFTLADVTLYRFYKEQKRREEAKEDKND